MTTNEAGEKIITRETFSNYFRQHPLDESQTVQLILSETLAARLSGNGVNPLGYAVLAQEVIHSHTAGFDIATGEPLKVVITDQTDALTRTVELVGWAGHIAGLEYAQAVGEYTMQALTSPLPESV